MASFKLKRKTFGLGAMASKVWNCPLGKTAMIGTAGVGALAAGGAIKAGLETKKALEGNMGS